MIFTSPNPFNIDSLSYLSTTYLLYLFTSFFSFLLWSPCPFPTNSRMSFFLKGVFLTLQYKVSDYEVKMVDRSLTGCVIFVIKTCA